MFLHDEQIAILLLTLRQRDLPKQYNYERNGYKHCSYKM